MVKTLRLGVLSDVYQRQQTNHLSTQVHLMWIADRLRCASKYPVQTTSQRHHSMQWSRSGLPMNYLDI